MANRLARESSPYLLQHQHNPVDWYPWGEEALERSRREEKPIFLSIGYSACHWCHVMEHESFEDAGIAARMNEHFVCVKVDREERPDLDQIYMNAVQLMTGRGGWPMSVFLTPDLRPFYGGTYWPPAARMGMPGFDQVLAAVSEAWRERREQVTAQSAELTRHLEELSAREAERDSEQAPRLALLTGAAGKLEQQFDFSHGGFGRAPKFPHSMDLQVLLRVWRREKHDGLVDMVRLTLDRMARGGIYDHLGGGFARYSVDERWLVPHFEKMLYDNALLAGAYLDGHLATGNADDARIVRETLDYVLRDMTDDHGGFHSTEDADSEGEEGKFYVWTKAEIQELLGADADRFCYVYDVSDEGNFEHKNILNLPKSIKQCSSLRGWELAELEAKLAQGRARLLAARNQRVRPGKDDKILVAWNGLMIDSLARAGGALGEPRYIAAAERAAEFIRRNMVREDGRLLHTWRHGVARLDAYLDDYACLANSLVSLYEATFQESRLDEAIRLAEILLRHFWDEQGGGFYFTADDHERLIVRNKDLHDSSVPSGNAMAATGLVRLAKLTGRDDFADAARHTLEMAAGTIAQQPSATGQMLIALDMYLGPLTEIAIVGDPGAAETARVLANLRRRYVPNHVVACRADPSQGSGSLARLFAGKTAGPLAPTVYVCRSFVCDAPASGPAEIAAAWDRLLE